MNNLAPILLFAYNRLDNLKTTIDTLKNNNLASQSELFIFSDNARNDKDRIPVENVRNYLKSVQGFLKVTVFEAPLNKGLANSIIEGVTKIINDYGKVIVVEDDLSTSPNFISFMNDSLCQYENNQLVYSISGFIFDMKIPSDYPYDVFFTKRHCSWGWAMWKDRWNKIDWKVSDFQQFLDSPNSQRAFDQIGADLTLSLKRQQKGEINSWAIRCNYQQFKEQTYTVYPIKSKVNNLGFGEHATHTTQRFNKYQATLDTELKYDFKFPEQVFEDPKLIQRFTNKYSKMTRLYYYILNTLFK